MKSIFKKIKYDLKETVVENLTKRGLFNLLPDKVAVAMDYFFTFGRLPDLKNPKKFSEKMQWIKINGGLERYSNFADKFEVRKYVTEKVGKKYLIPLYGVWDEVSEIDFKKLPKKFVLKGTHGSGCNFICKDKSKINEKELREKVGKWLARNYYIKLKEPQYKSIKPRIIAEKYISDFSGGLIDYKIFCYNGIPRYIDVHIGRFVDHRTFYKDTNWKTLPIHVDREPADAFTFPTKPPNFVEMLNVAKKLANGFPFIRVDLYSVKGQTYFGELTFIPANGLLKYTEDSADYFLGKHIELERYKIQSS